MALKVRRVVTGHDGNGKAVVKTDEEMKHELHQPARRAGGERVDDDRSPASIDGDADEGLRTAVILVDAKPVEVGSRVLNAVG